MEVRMRLQRNFTWSSKFWGFLSNLKLMCNRVAGADADYCRRGKSDVAGWTVVGDIPICKWKLAWRP
jgi:hypothetical protein